MKFTLAICLLFTHYVCGSPCTIAEDTSSDTSAIIIFNSTLSNIKPTVISQAAQSLYKTYQIHNYKHSLKRYRKAPKLLTICLQSNIKNAAFSNQNTAKNIQQNTHAFNRWLPNYLSLFAIFRV